ncbi:MAG: DUF1365 domain-containing protein [Halochromatium sp.]|uniref:DUF1365 domain-containing protein n=1 Tax=Halochromatium sp. TaxID=2049430 RepID=UPI00397B50E1
MNTNPHRIYFTHVMHRRLFPAPYRFTYRVFSLLLDLDALDQVPGLLRIGKGFGLLRFAPEDHGPRDGSPLRPWAEQLLRARGIDLEGGRIRLLCMPRVLGYGFNPLSLWYCEHADGRLRAVLAEVSNTFGESHFYLLANGGEPLAWPVRDQATKCFYVSPLMEMGHAYHFRLAEPGDKLGVFIRQFHPDGRLQLVATQTGVGEPLSQPALWRALARTPLMSFKVLAAIHWQALKIWLRGTPYVPKTDPPPPKVT